MTRYCFLFQAEEREENIRKAQSQLHNRIGPGPSRESRERNTKKGGVFLPTPIILGNPVYGSPDPVTSNPNLTQKPPQSPHSPGYSQTVAPSFPVRRDSGPTQSSPVTGPKPGLRRNPVQTPPAGNQCVFLYSYYLFPQFTFSLSRPPSIILSIKPFIYLCTYYQSIHITNYLSIYLSIYLSVCLSVCHLSSLNYFLNMKDENTFVSH